jgi:hypothetical protein
MVHTGHPINIKNQNTMNQIESMNTINNAIQNDNPTKIVYMSQGQKSKMFTLWTDFINGSPFVKPRFIKSLSTNKEKALAEAMAYATKINCPFYDESKDELKKIVRVYTWTPTMVRFGKNYGKELRDCEPKFVLWVAKGCYLQDEKTGTWYQNEFGGREFRIEAEKIAVEMGLGLMETRFGGNKFVTREQYDINTAKINERASIVSGFHGTNGERVTMELTITRVTGFDTMFGFQNVYIMKDDQNREFTYKGTSHVIHGQHWVEIVDGKEYKGWDTRHAIVGDVVSITGTIKHDSYNGKQSTYLQRIKHPYVVK